MDCDHVRYTWDGQDYGYQGDQVVRCRGCGQLLTCDTEGVPHLLPVGRPLATHPQREDPLYGGDTPDEVVTEEDS